MLSSYPGANQGFTLTASTSTSSFTGTSMSPKLVHRYIDGVDSPIYPGQKFWVCTYGYARSGLKCTEIVQPTEVTIDANYRMWDEKTKSFMRSGVSIFSTADKCGHHFGILVSNHIRHLSNKATQIANAVELSLKRCPQLRDGVEHQSFKQSIHKT